MSSKHGRVEAMIQVPTDGWVASIQGAADGSPVNATVAAGTYYMTTLYAEVETQFDSASATDWTVTWADGEGGTGKVTIACAGGNGTVDWTATDLRDALGYELDGNLSGAATYESTDQAKMVWFPDGTKETEYGDNDDGWQESDLRGTESPGGLVKSLAGNRKTANWVRWNGVSRAKCRIAGEATGNESFEQFWVDAIMGEGPGGIPGARWEFYWDADVATSLNCVPGGVSNLQTLLEKLSPNMVENWRIFIPRLVKVPA